MLTGNYTRNQGLVCLLSWKTSLTSSEAIGPLEGRVKAAAVASIAAWGRVSYQFISCEAAVAKTTWLQLASNPSIPRWYRLNYSDRNLTGNPQDMIKHSVWKSLEKVSHLIFSVCNVILVFAFTRQKYLKKLAIFLLGKNVKVRLFQVFFKQCENEESNLILNFAA